MTAAAGAHAAKRSRLLSRRQRDRLPTALQLAGHSGWLRGLDSLVLSSPRACSAKSEGSRIRTARTAVRLSIAVARLASCSVSRGEFGQYLRVIAAKLFPSLSMVHLRQRGPSSDSTFDGRAGVSMCGVQSCRGVPLVLLYTERSRSVRRAPSRRVGTQPPAAKTANIPAVRLRRIPFLAPLPGGPLVGKKSVGAVILAVLWANRDCGPDTDSRRNEFELADRPRT